MVTIAIPTYNRDRYINKSIDSALKQTYKDIEVLVVDNASTDSTSKLVKKYNDKRVRYIRNKKNVGMMNNWNKCIRLAKGDYLLILGDDDVLSPDAVKIALNIHKNNNLGFTFAHCNKVDEEGEFIQKWGYKYPSKGKMSGVEYLYYTLKYQSCLTNSSTVLVSAKVYKEVGDFTFEKGKNTFDFNMWIKIASRFDVFFIDRVICDYRVHKDQVSETHWGKKSIPTGKIGTYLELYKVISILDKKVNESSLFDKSFLYKETDKVTKNLTALLTKVLPEL